MSPRRPGQKAAAPNNAAISALIADASSQDYKRRQAAQRELTATVLSVLKGD